MSSQPTIIAPDYAVLENQAALRVGFTGFPMDVDTSIEHKIIRTEDVTLLWLTHRLAFLGSEESGEFEQPIERERLITARMVHVIGFSRESTVNASDETVVASGRLTVHGRVRQFIADVANSMDEPTPFFPSVPNWAIQSREENESDEEESLASAGDN